MERMKKRWEDETLLHLGRRETHTDFKRNHMQDKEQSLNGTWRFLYMDAPEYSPEGFYQKDFPDDNWDTILVPSCWQLQGYGSMHYTDVWYLFPIHPPFVPTKNPTGIYRTSIQLDKSSENEKTILKFHGVNSAYDLWVNGTHCGYSKVSRLSSEFDISDYVSIGDNQITVRVYQWSDGSYLECQDMWWYSGIFRDVTLYREPSTSIRDCIIESSLTNQYTTGQLLGTIDIDPTKEDLQVEYTLCEKDKTDHMLAHGLARKEKGQYVFSHLLDHIKPWTAETPNLYTVIITLKRNHLLLDEVTLTTGFRTIEILDQNLTVNGKAILLNGVNMHDFSPTGGNTVDPQVVEQDLILMKQHNINAIRCAHYPKMDYFYDLCDLYGFYVIDEADLETHGFEWVERYRWLNEEPSWENAYKDRSGRMVQAHRNHPSIIMWSMGNESDIGINFTKTASYIKELDSSRLLHYESDYEADITDVYSTMYTRLKQLEEIAVGDDKHGKPHILCEYGHAMGNGPGNLEEYQEMFRSYKRLQGGFIWEWYDHGIQQKDKDGNITYYYGGDFQDEPNNSNFCMDGLLLPNREISTGLSNYKQVIAPVLVSPWDLEKGIIKVKNLYDFLDFSNLILHWEVCHDNKVDERGSISSLEIPAQEEVLLSIPYKELKPLSGTDYYLNLSFVLKESTNYAKLGHSISKSQLKLPIYKEKVFRSREEKDPIQWKEDPITITFFNSTFQVTFHKVEGKLKRYEYLGDTIIEEGPSMNVKRATIDNDMYKVKDWNEKYFFYKDMEQVEGIKWERKDHEAHITIQTHYSFLSQTFGFQCLYEYVIHSNGDLELSLTGNAFKYSSFYPDMIPRVGIEMRLPKTMDQVMWYGLGFEENYSDVRSLCMNGVYQTDVKGMHTDYAMPQENGHREGVQWLALGNGTQSLLINSTKDIGINIHDYTIDGIDQAKHMGEIQYTDATIVHLDAKHSGVGSNSCGEEQLYKNKTKINDFSMNLTFQVVKEDEVIEESKVIKGGAL